MKDKDKYTGTLEELINNDNLEEETIEVLKEMYELQHNPDQIWSVEVFGHTPMIYKEKPIL